MTATMKAMTAISYGLPASLQLAEVDRPAPKAGELLVRVYASSATTADSMMLSGKPWFARLFIGLSKPKHPIPGTGFAGVIEAVGEEVTAFKPGQRVFGETLFGFSANAEYLTVSEKEVVLEMPEGMGYAEAAPFCDGPLTSLNFLQEIGKIKAGDGVLINGAAGSLGTAAVQLARLMGAHVTAVCSTRNVGLVESLGADEVIDYTKKDFTQMNHRFDVIFDTVGKSSFKAAKKVLKEDGQYLSPVMNMPLLGQMMWTTVFGKKKAKFAATGMKSPNELRSLLEQLKTMYAEGKIKSVIDRQYPLEKLSEAHSYIASGHKRGNVVIITENLAQS
ncbi:MAG: NAD(P)-dependent alcohol dehydrogenase [Bacteroidia bacterium]